MPQCVQLEAGVRISLIDSYRPWTLRCLLGAEQLAVLWISGRETTFLTKIYEENGCMFKIRIVTENSGHVVAIAGKGP